MRVLAAVCGVACALHAHVVAAQAPARAMGVAVSRSVGSRTAAHPPSCRVACASSDVLGPVALTTLELEVAIPLRTRDRSGLEYVLRAVPLVLVEDNPTEPAVRFAWGWTLPSTTSRASTVGFGIAPAGLRAWIGGNDDVRFEAELAAGVLRFGAPLLAANASRLNFTYELGLGVRFSRFARGGWAIGYRRHHVSNAGLADVNPGLDSHVLYVGAPIG
jgi:hypothetical protein